MSIDRELAVKIRYQLEHGPCSWCGQRRERMFVIMERASDIAELACDACMDEWAPHIKAKFNRHILSTVQ